MVKQRDIQFFRAKVNGKEYSFRCYTTWTRNGFCHTVHFLQSWEFGFPVSDTKVSYLNRTWERFTYESALRRMIGKFPADMQEALTAQIIDGKAAEEEKKAEDMLSSFERLYSGLSPENKERMKSFPHLETEEDARACMGLMGLLSLMQG